MPKPLRRGQLLLAFVAILALPPTRASGQYLYLDANADALNSSIDRIAPGSTLTIDVWLDTAHNRDGSSATCQEGDLPLTLTSYQVIIHAAGGTMNWGTFTNRVPQFNLDVGSGHDTVDLFAGFASSGATKLTPGLYRLGSVSATVISGAPSLEIAGSTPLSFSAATSFGSDCFGVNYDNTLTFGMDWLDADGIQAGTTVPPSGSPPSLSQPLNMTVSEGSTADQTISASDPDGDPINFSLASGPSYASVATSDPGTGFGSGNIHLAPGSDDQGVSAATVRAFDGSLAALASFGITVLNVNQAPVLAPLADMLLKVGGFAKDQRLVAVDPDRDQVQFSKVSGPSFATVTTLSATTPDSSTGNVHVQADYYGDAGIYPITIRASDGLLSDTKSFVATVVRVPYLTLGAERVVAPNTTLSTSIRMMPSGVGSTTVSCNGAPAGLTFAATTESTATITWTPLPSQVGAYTLQIHADNHYGDTQDGNLSIRVTNPPVVSAPFSAVTAEQDPLQVHVTATDPEGDPILYLYATGTAVQAGALFNLDNPMNTAGTLYWTPAAGKAGVYYVTFNAFADFPANATTQITVVGALAVTNPATGDILQTGPGTPSLVVSWTMPPSSAVDHFRITLMHSEDGGATYGTIQLADNVPASARSQSAAIPDEVNSTTARIRVEACDTQGQAVQSFDLNGLVLWAQVHDHVLLSAENPVFAWDPVPPGSNWAPSDVTHYEVSWQYDRFSSVPAPSNVPIDFDGYWWTEQNRYRQYSAADWAAMPVGVWKRALRAVRVHDGQEESLLYPDEFYVRANVQMREQGVGPGSHRQVLMVHGWRSSSGETFGCEFLKALSDDAFDVWTIDYPNVTDIRWSAGALRTSLEYLRRATGVPTVNVIAHSMGGLVSRAYIQSSAVDVAAAVAASEQGAQPPSLAYANDIGTLVTLDTPHQGAPARAAWSAVNGSYGYSALDPTPISVIQLEDTGSGSLLQALYLNYGEREQSVRHLFLQGTKPFNSYAGFGCDPGDVGSRLYQLVSIRLEDENDGAVESRRAVARSDPFPYLPTDRRWCAPQSHTSITHLNAASDEYRNRIVPFLNGTYDEVEGEPINCDESRNKTTTVTVQKSGRFSYAVTSPSRTARLSGEASAGTQDPIPGVTVELTPVGDDSLSSLVAQTDDRGDLGISSLPTGDYRVRLSGRGFVARSVLLHVDENADAVNAQYSLDDDPAVAGPTGPYVRIVASSGTVPDSVVTLELGASNATEMVVGVDRALATATWQPVAPTATLTLPGGSGLRVAYAAFRDGSGNVSDTVSACVYVKPENIGSLSVSSAPSGAEVLLDGRRTGLLTPVAMDSLVEGFHSVQVSLTGYRSESGAISSWVANNAPASAAFNLVASGSPSSPNPIVEPGLVETTTRPLLMWSRSTDPDPGDAVTYRVQIARDEQFTDLLRDTFGTWDTTYVSEQALPDSLTFWWRVQASDSHGLTSGWSAAVGPVLLDATPPGIALISPSIASSVLLGQSYSIQWCAADWSGVDSVSAFLSRDGGQSFSETIFHAEANDSAATWVVGGPTSSQCRMRLVAYDHAGNVAEANVAGDFRISEATGISQVQAAPAVFALHRVTPNPFAPSTTVRFDVPSRAFVRIAVFDLRGRIVARLLEEDRPAGTYAIRWDGWTTGGSHAASGVYFIRMEAADFRASRKLILAK